MAAKLPPASGRQPPLYNRAVLALAVECSKYRPLAEPDRWDIFRAALCGSEIALGLSLDGDGRVSAAGMTVSACALGQAAAAVFARQVPGLAAHDLAAARDAVAHWLAGQGALPDWPGMDILAPVRDFPARHGAVLLPFRAGAELAARPA